MCEFFVREVRVICNHSTLALYCTVQHVINEISASSPCSAQTFLSGCHCPPSHVSNWYCSPSSHSPEMQ